jgi:hypothetical protein
MRTTPQLRQAVMDAECSDSKCGLCALWNEIESHLWRLECAEERITNLQRQIADLTQPKKDVQKLP